MDIFVVKTPTGALAPADEHSAEALRKFRAGQGFRVAYLCHDCHAEIDQGNQLSKPERLEMWETAHRKTVEWWFLSGILEVK